MTTTLNASTAGAGGFIATSDNSGVLALQTAGTTAITVDASQNVGIGNTSPSFPLDIVKSANGNAHAKITNSNGGGSAASAWTASNGTLTSQFGITGASYTSYGILTANSAYIYNTNDISLGADNASGVIKFGTGSGINERMRIDSSGRVCIGVNSAAYSTACAMNVNVDTVSASGGAWVSKAASTSTAFHLNFQNGNGGVGGISTSGSATQYVTSSDYRLKENIAPMTGALAKVALLKPVTYKWKVDGSNGEGFIAHELAEVKPDCVSGDKDAVDADGNPKYQGIDVSFLVATLTAAIQELKALTDTQASTITALTARITALEAK